MFFILKIPQVHNRLFTNEAILRIGQPDRLTKFAESHVVARSGQVFDFALVAKRTLFREVELPDVRPVHFNLGVQDEFVVFGAAQIREELHRMEQFVHGEDLFFIPGPKEVGSAGDDLVFKNVRQNDIQQPANDIKNAHKIHEILGNIEFLIFVEVVVAQVNVGHDHQKHEINQLPKSVHCH